MDGTLIDTDYANYLSYRQALRDVTHGAMDIRFDPRRRFNREELMKAFPQLNDTVVNKICNLKGRCYRRFLPETKLNSALVDILKKSRTNNKAALVTNCQKDRVAMTLQHHQLEEYFSYVFCRSEPSDGESRNKYTDAIARVKAKPESVLAFENVAAEIEKAILAGIPRENIFNIGDW